MTWLYIDRCRNFSGSPVMAFFFSKLCFIAFIFLRRQIGCSGEKSAVKFTADLVHRYSSLSPYYDPTLTRFDIVKKSITRRRRLSTRSSPPPPPSLSSSSPVAYDGGGGYVMKISLGSQNYSLWPVADTGSFLTWTQCSPCSLCYQQLESLFNPSRSSTYRPINCSSQPCENSKASSCRGATSPCTYQVLYGDYSYSVGVIAEDTLSFPKAAGGYDVVFCPYYFGCGTDNGGLFSSSDDGILGLGHNPISIITQMGIFRFSYCLPDVASDSQSAISFGPDSGPTFGPGPNVISTRLYDQQFYYFNLSGFVIGSAAIANPAPAELIDSGTTLTYLHPALAGGISSALIRKIGCPRAAAVESEEDFPLCFNTTSCRFPAVAIAARLSGSNGDLSLPMGNVFVEVEAGIQCLTIAGSDATPYVWGNTAQQNFGIVYDLANGTLSFQYTGCSSV
ncbi:hypothetical protein M569_06264 [Genlisea aurea]|uniref:Peptidase A1 domain-containing protein n=1 Tax=Genlisea aurea TaxID=192259 RepID=S8CP59_9LAMI|nr:hypothetical protein M569_06264 [Genlisea aurea]